MERVRTRAAVFVIAALAACVAAGCRKEVPETLDLQGSQLQIYNDTGDNWNNVEVWLNSYFRATVSSIPAHSRYKVPLNAFVSGYAQRFEFGRMQISAVRLTSKKPDGSIMEINKQFQEGGLAGVAGTLGGKP
jgi:hypothetical protein